MEKQPGYIPTTTPVTIKNMNNLGKAILRYQYYYLLLLPGFLLFLLFQYGPMYGIIIAFKDFKISRGIMNSPWIGFKWFDILFNGGDFWLVLKNSLIISFYKIVFDFPAPIILALLLNELKNMVFKRTVQTIVYLPHFLNWVILGGILTQLLSSSSGLLGILGIQTSPLMDPKQFRSLLVVSTMWKNAGWGTIIYLAAITGISPELYEAAIIDGANRLQQVRYITLPSIMSTVVILLILRTGHILNAGFDQIFMLYNPMVYSVADILDTYVYRIGLTAGRYSLATAAGLFKSVIGMSMILFTNWLAGRMGERGIW